MHCIFIDANDSALGRIDPTMLDNQTRMELLVEGLSDESKKKYKDASGNFLDIQEWDGVYLDKDTKEIAGFTVRPRTHGAVAFEFLPDSVVTFGASRSDIEGTVPVELLPRGLKVFDISYIGSMNGTIDFCALPPALEICYLAGNKFTGTADLTRLPDHLESLHIDGNDFYGTLSLSNLPASLHTIWISGNEFCGCICEAKISDSLADLYASNCRFTGSFVYENLPEGANIVDLSENQISGKLSITDTDFHEDINLSGSAFTGTAVVHSSMFEHVTFDGNRIEALVDECGDKIECLMSESGFVDSIYWDED